MSLLPVRRRPRILAIAGSIVAALVLLALLVLAAFPIGLLRGIAERRLSASMGRPVRIGSIDREGRFSLHPTIVVQGLVVPQPRWAGMPDGGGDLARVERAEITLPVLPLLHGRVEPSAIRVAGARLVLVRLADGRESWKGESGRSSGSGGGGAVLEHLTVSNSTIAYRDFKQGRQFVLSVMADPAAGLRARGRGTVLGAPVRVSAAAPPVERRTPAGWPFRATIDGPDLGFTAAGTMAAPLDTGRMTLDVTARARDLKLIDAIVEAGLFHTQPVRMSAHVEHDGPRWRITKLAGTVGRSTIDGQVSVDKVDGRSRIDGSVHAGQLDFDDLADDTGRAKAAALRAAIGDRLVPDTRINIRKIWKSDIALSFRADRLLSRTPSALRSLSGRATLDRRLLIVSPFTLGLARGAITGRMVVDQHDGAPVPLVRLDLRLAGSSVPALLGGGGTTVTGRLDARALLAGRGSTIREAVGASSGRIGVAARDGALPAQIADALGFDAGRALLAGRDERAGLRCAIVGLDMRDGIGRVDPLVIDTSASRLDGEGTVAFPGETLAIRLTGAPKRGSLLRLPGSASMQGTIKDPHVVVPREVKSVGNILKAIGRKITGDEGPTATDADCGALAARVLR